MTKGRDTSRNTVGRIQGRLFHPMGHSRIIVNASSSFGVATVLLELVPVASILFAFTNTVGAALWAADIEKGNTTEQGTAPKLREQAKNAE